MVPSVYTNNKHYLSHSTQVAEGTVFMKHGIKKLNCVCVSALMSRAAQIVFGVCVQGTNIIGAKPPSRKSTSLLQQE